MKKKVIVIDFDGVLHKSSRGFSNGDIYDVPSEGAVFTIKNLVKEYEVIILTARPKKDFEKMEEWLDQHGFPKLKITNRKPPAQCYVDDKAIRFVSFKDLSKYYL